MIFSVVYFSTFWAMHAGGRTVFDCIFLVITLLIIKIGIQEGVSIKTTSAEHAMLIELDEEEEQGNKHINFWIILV